MAISESDQQQVLKFWFSEASQKLWFNSTDEFDQAIREQFLPTWELASHQKLKDWERTVDGALALVIILDQFPLNMFRGKPESFATEQLARDVASEAIANGFDKQSRNTGKMFFYLPFMHSEDIKDQEYSIRLFKTAGLAENLKFAHHHHEIIKRFGRFPHRNEILGRKSTSQELVYLASKEAFHG